MATSVDESLRLAQAAFAQGHVEESRGRCAQLMQAAPDDPRVLHLAAVLELSAGNPVGALSLAERALRSSAGDARLHHTRGLALRAAQRPQEAAGAFREATRLLPAFAEAHAALGRALLGTGDPAAAVNALARAVELKPQAFDFHNDLGVALLEQGRGADAEASFRRAMALAPERSHAWNNLGNALRSSGRDDEAIAAFRAATAREPPLAAAWVNLGNLLRERDRIDEAKACFARALELDPTNSAAHLSAAIAHLLDADFQTGWHEYAWRRQARPDESKRAAIAALQPGSAIEIEAEQGLGDVIFFLRWAAALHERGARLRLHCDPRLFPLLEPLGWFESMAPPGAARDDGAALQIALADLPWLLGDRAGDYPPSIPLKPRPADLEAAQALLASFGPPPYVGLAWRAGIPSTGGGEHLFKEVPVAQLGAALKGVQVTLVSLQRGPEPGEAEAMAKAAGRPLFDASALNADLPAMLGLLAALDEYVGVSSTNVHLRAAIGEGARVLVPLPPEWRYGRSGEATAWFSDFRVYREARDGGWREALASLGGALRARFGEAP